MSAAPRRALVTGGTRGIGEATAIVLRDAGFDVVTTGTAKTGSGPAGCRYVGVDLAKPANAEAFAAEMAAERFAVLVNNAGMNKVGPLEQYALSDLENVLNVNLIAPYVLCRALVPGMRAARYGRIVNITSIFGLVSKAGRSAYSASKFGLFGMTRALALEVAADNVLVNCVAPGFVDTDMTRRVLGDAGIAEMVRQVPMGRLATPEEIARFIAFLCGEDNSFMTGQTVVLDGGFTCV
ncbi:MAG: SDR family oxidoreductase [Acidobacteria bacterium]|nr:MAG: SDR family oxidoreductase [Acidobacteriota bacterium]